MEKREEEEEEEEEEEGNFGIGCKVSLYVGCVRA